MLKDFSKTGNARKVFVRATMNSSIEQELEFFRVIESNFDSLIFLHYFDAKRSLYMNVDASKKYEFDFIVYHVESDSKIDTVLRDDKIMKFSRTKI